MDTKKTFIEICHLLHAKGLVSGSGGNVSMKVGDRVLITPTGRSLGFITEDDLVWVEKDGTYTNGIPSKEVMMHLSCYEARPDITAVVHVHSVYSVAISCRKDIDPYDAMPHYTPGYAMRVGKLPVVGYSLPGSAELAEDVKRVLKVRNSVLLQNHGSVICGKSLEEAFDIMEEIEKNAHLCYVLGDKGVALTPEQETGLR